MFGATLVVPASAQSGSASGSCGYVAGSYGLNSLSPIDIRNPNRGLGAPTTVGRVHFQAEYSGVAPGTAMTIVRYTGQMQDGIDWEGNANTLSFTAESASGTFAGSSAVGADTGATRLNRNRGIVSSKGRSGRNGGTSNSSQAGAGLYIFQVWAGNSHIGGWTCAIDSQ